MNRYFPIFAVCLLAVASAGCTTHKFARRNTVKHASTLTDLLYGQVLDNVAMFESNPHSLPHFALVGTGTTQAIDLGGGDVTLTWNAFGIINERLGMNGRRQLSQQWSTSPVMSPGRLERMRCALQIATNKAYAVEFVERERETDEGVVIEYVLIEDDANQCVQCIKKLVSFGILPQPSEAIDDDPNIKVDSELRFYADQQFGDKLLTVVLDYQASLRHALACKFPQCWYSVTNDKKRIKNACYVGRHCDTFVVVDWDGVDALSRLTMSLLTLASKDTLQPMLQVERNLGEYYLKQTRVGNINKFEPPTFKVLKDGNPVMEGEINIGDAFIPPGNMPFALPGGSAVVPQVIQ